MVATPTNDWGTALSAMLGGGLLAGAAMLVRAFTHRGTARTDDWEQTVGLTEKLLARRTRELEEARQRADRVLEENRRLHDDLAQARRELRGWRLRYGDLSDPRFPRITPGEPKEGPR